MAILVKLTNPELVFLQDTLDSAREEFEELIREEDWYVTDLDERCLSAFNILKYAEKQTIEDTNETGLE
jgi:hypothetical protein